MESLSPEEQNIIKDIRNYFRLNKKQNYSVVKDIRELKIKYLEIFRIFLNMEKKKKIIINQ